MSLTEDALCFFGFKLPCDDCYYKPCEGSVYDDSGYVIEPVCDYTGELCGGNKMFCEECMVFVGEEGSPCT